MTEDVSPVQTTIIKPMLALYMPPQQLRESPQKIKTALSEYHRVLRRFDQGILEKAWELVVAEHPLVVWPSPGVIVGCCRRVLSWPGVQTEEGKRQSEALQMTEKKVGAYMKSSKLAKEARKEGWSADLREFVNAQVWIQCQLICGVRNIGFDHRFLADGRQFSSASEAFQHIRKWLGQGFLKERKPKVKPPSRNLVEKWREEATKLKETVSPKEKYMRSLPSEELSDPPNDRFF